MSIKYNKICVMVLVVMGLFLSGFGTENMNS